MIRRTAALALVVSGLGAWPAVAQVTAERADRDKPISSAASAADVCAALSNRVIDGSRLAADLVPATAAAPVYCRVRGTIAPRLNFEIRLPQHWNRKLYYGGGGGYNGVIPELVVAPLKQGYAQVVSDSGHQDPTGMSAAFVQNDPAAARLFGSEAVPTVMAATLQILTEAYGAPPSKSYFEGCSTGGREALMAVQRNPGLFDGVIARAPAFNWVGFMGAFQATARAAAAPGGSFGPAKAALLARHVRAACDGLDGLIDGVVANRDACTAEQIGLGTLRCADGADLGDACLSDAQLTVVKTWTADHVFQGLRGIYLSKGYPLSGNEDDPAGFGLWATGNGDVRQSGYFVMQDSTVKYYLAKDPNADSLAYAPWDRNPQALDAMAALNDATDPDIRAFIDGGGKLIVWQGGSDAALSVASTIDYMVQMTQAVGPERAADSTRFYVAPGANHCGGGAGPDQTDLLDTLDRWVMDETAPGVLLAEKFDPQGARERSLPLCLFPQYPR
ncbi:tannase/feruloyl esterase family alpha/beta hydrolase [Brevundimonas nasdae]|uniref:tannase/feruloyl esterase family alpha/beta hydrolase n=1 Tax=Brevundimonas nasdae TaxID=172043 RepID=UPI0012EE702A|nr:tannase/feruloyl esterase family alpha/beta hydrolase [Brevundimonas nasdae]